MSSDLDESVANIISESIKNSSDDPNRPRPHILVVEESEDKGGAFCSAAIVGNPVKVLGMTFTLLIKVAEAMGEVEGKYSESFSDLKDPRKLIRLMDDMFHDQMDKQCIKDLGKKEL